MMTNFPMQDSNSTMCVFFVFILFYDKKNLTDDASDFA